jgi:hypothetical protein
MRVEAGAHYSQTIRAPELHQWQRLLNFLGGHPQV